MNLNISKYLKIIAYLIAIVGVVASSVFSSVLSDNSSSFIVWVFGIIISITAGLVVRAFAEIIQSMQQGFYEVMKTQTETRNMLSLIYDEIQSKNK